MMMDIEMMKPLPEGHQEADLEDGISSPMDLDALLQRLDRCSSQVFMGTPSSWHPALLDPSPRPPGEATPARC